MSTEGPNYGLQMGPKYGPPNGPLMGLLDGPLYGACNINVSAPCYGLVCNINVSVFKNVSLGTGSCWPLDAGGLGVERGKLTADPAAVRIDAQPDLFDRDVAVHCLGRTIRVLGELVQIEIVGTGISDLDCKVGSCIIPG